VAVRAEIPNPDLLLRPGMLMSVQLFREPRDTLVVPEIAILQVGMNAFVYRVTAEETAERVPVELGARRKGEVEIVRGLSAGDRIVTEGAVKLRDGARVSLAEPA
jgi:membrane fusion protein (multidrug efflux system)